ncbi:MAG: hypothetical protein KAH21_07515 [Spirochaetaceae bacterium]|nr:hypothetical protein [Spirochaetaceae bacterium]
MVFITPKNVTIGVQEGKQMDRTMITIGKAEEMDQLDREYWSQALIAEKLETITYLRECFYGKEATTGRLQRIYTVFKQT